MVGKPQGRAKDEDLGSANPTDAGSGPSFWDGRAASN
jgi:hypothetical protein